MAPLKASPHPYRRGTEEPREALSCPVLPVFTLSPREEQRRPPYGPASAPRPAAKPAREVLSPVTPLMSPKLSRMNSAFRRRAPHCKPAPQCSPHSMNAPGARNSSQHPEIQPPPTNGPRSPEPETPQVNPLFHNSSSLQRNCGTRQVPASCPLLGPPGATLLSHHVTPPPAPLSNPSLAKGLRRSPKK